MGYIYDMTDNWADAGTAYDAIKMVVSKTAAHADSRLINIQLDDGGGAADRFVVDQNGSATIPAALFEFAPSGYETSTQNNALYARAELDFQGAAGFASAVGVWGTATGHGTSGMTASASAYIQGGVFFSKRGGASDVANSGSFYLYGQNCIAELSADAKGNVGSATGGFFAVRVRSHSTPFAAGILSNTVVGVYDNVNVAVTDAYGVYIENTYGKDSGNVTTIGATYGLYIKSTVNATAAITDQWGIYQVTAADKNYFAGPVQMVNADIRMTGLPTSDPGVAGRLYTLAGVLKVSGA